MLGCGQFAVWRDHAPDRDPLACASRARQSALLYSSGRAVLLKALRCVRGLVYLAVAVVVFVGLMWLLVPILVVLGLLRLLLVLTGR